MDSHGILGFTPELFYLEIPLLPLEEPLNLSSIMIELRKHYLAEF